LKAPFIEAEREVECHDVLRVDDEGRDLDPPRSSPVADFARKNGEAAIPFYEAVIAKCQDSLGWARPALFALAHLGTPRAIELLNRYAQTGQPVREAAVYALLGVPAFASSQSVAEHLLHEPDPELRRVYAAWLWAHGDARALPGLREALPPENDHRRRR
jgi:HEAT repeat protein